MWSILALVSFITAILSTVLAVKGKHQMYWVATFGTYFFSMLAAFSIGQAIFSLTFIPLALAIGYSFNFIKNKLHAMAFLSVGLLVGLTLTILVDDYWLFFPLQLFG